MRVVLFSHPEFLASQSMPRFSGFIASGMRERGVAVETVAPRAFFYRLRVPGAIRKWLGYIDQFVVFPVWMLLRRFPEDALFVFADQALGPWVPLVSHRPHVIHCHDFLALRSSLGEIPWNRVSRTGRIYQRLIRWGFRKGKNFLSVSERTQQDLLRMLSPAKPAYSRVIYNGLNYAYRPVEQEEAHRVLTDAGVLQSGKTFLMHVGGNQWYKNRAGVIAIYRAYANRVNDPLPLLMIGADPTPELEEMADALGGNGRIQFVVRPSSEVLRAAYSSAAALIFPSLAEGFGWPIAEAMACGCPVITTRLAPMTEVGGAVATYLPVMTGLEPDDEWAQECAASLIDVLSRSAAERERIRIDAIERARLFDSVGTIDSYLVVYRAVFAGVAQ